jgi:hypothetical protein
MINTEAVDEDAISTDSQRSAASLLTATMLGMGAGIVGDLLGLGLTSGLTATVVFEIGISIELISGDCAANVCEITDITGQDSTGTIITTPTHPGKTQTGRPC